MSWHSFRYVFSPDLQRAMRYSIEESIRKVAQTAPLGGTSAEMADMAVASFVAKLEKHTGRPFNLGQGGDGK